MASKSAGERQIYFRKRLEGDIHFKMHRECEIKPQNELEKTKFALKSPKDTGKSKKHVSFHLPQSFTAPSAFLSNFAAFHYTTKNFPLLNCPRKTEFQAPFEKTKNSLHFSASFFFFFRLAI